MTITTAKITIEPAAGFQAVMVDGAIWGRIQTERHGNKGATYSFWQTGAGMIVEEREGRRRPVEVRSALAERRAVARAGGSAKIDPLADRLLAKAYELVAAGKLRNPDVVAAERQASKDAFHATIEAERVARLAGYVERARRIIVNALPVHLVIDNSDLTEIAEAVGAEFEIVRREGQTS